MPRKKITISNETYFVAGQRRNDGVIMYYSNNSKFEPELNQNTVKFQEGEMALKFCNNQQNWTEIYEVTTTIKRIER